MSFHAYKRIFSFVFICCVLVMGSGGCSSKFAESSPDSIATGGVSLNERLEQKQHVDDRLVEIQKIANRLKAIIEMFRKVTNRTDQEFPYTPLDFLDDISRELKTKVPDIRNGKFVRLAKVNLRVAGLPEECRIVETKLESDAAIKGLGSAASYSGEHMTFSVRTCRSGGQFLDVIVFDWIDSKMEFKFINKSLDFLFPKDLVESALSSTSCRVTHSSKKILDTLTCEDIDVRLSATETAQVRSLVFSNSSETRFEAQGIVSKKSKATHKFVIRIIDGQKPTANFSELEQPTDMGTAAGATATTADSPPSAATTPPGDESQKQ